MKYCPECASELKAKPIDGRERLVCSAADCDFIYWNNPLPVVAAVVQYGDKIMLARNAQWPSGVFSLVTGFLESKETPEQAVVRETGEELGLDAEAKAFLGHYPVFRRNQIIMAFWVSATGEPRLNEEIVEIKLVTAEQLRAYDFGHLAVTRAIVQEWLGRL